MTSNKKTKDATFLWFESKIGIGITLTDEGLYFLVCPRFVKYDNLSFTYGGSAIGSWAKAVGGFRRAIVFEPIVEPTFESDLFDDRQVKLFPSMYFQNPIQTVVSYVPSKHSVSTPCNTV